MRCCRQYLSGGGRGIRTPARLSPPLGFQDRPPQPDLGIPPPIDMKYYSRRKKEASSIFTSPASSLQVGIRGDSFFI